MCRKPPMEMELELEELEGLEELEELELDLELRYFASRSSIS